MGHRRLTLRLVPVAVVVWGVALLAVMVPDAAAGAAAALWIIVGAALTGALMLSRPGRGRRRAHLLAIVILAAAGAAATASHVGLAQPSRDAAGSAAVTGGRSLTMQATITGKVERRADGSIAFDAVAARIEAGSRAYPAGVPIIVEVDPRDVHELGALDVGAVVEAGGTARSGMPGDRAVLRVRASRGVTVISAPAGLLQATSALRHGLVASVRGLPEPGAGLIPGLAVGDTSAVSAELDAQMKRSSLSHLTAVSGANCALVVGLAFAAAAALGARRAVRVGVGLAALGGFVVLVTPEPSVVRAAVMAAIAMLGVLLGRVGAGISMLALAVAILLVADPWLATSLGFALSASATASLLLFARPLASGLSRRLPHALALALAVPIAAQLACGPLLVLITPTVPVYGVLANLLAAPAAPVATVIGLAACLSAPVPLLRDGLSALAWLPASWISSTAVTITQIPGDTLPWVDEWPGAVLLAVVGLALGAVIALPVHGPRSARMLRAAAVMIVALTAGTAGGVAALGSFAGRWTLPREWSVLACDVGQGDAVLVRSAGVVMLVDTGPAPEPLAACLTRAGISRIDLLVLTHFDLDHVGGAQTVTGRVGTVLHGPVYGEGARILAGFEAAGTRVVSAHAGMTGILGEAHWRVVWPPLASRAFPSGNDASVVVDVRGGAVPPTLLLGDMSATPQRALAASGALDPPYAIVKVAHHGSADQDAALYRDAAPLIALVTVGIDNDYGHPRAETLAILEAIGARIMRTDREGVLAVSPAPDGWQLWRERGGVVGGGG